jgi:hypothetical protein
MASPIEIAAVPGLFIVRKCLKNVKGLAWIHSLLDKAKWTSSPKLQEPSDPTQIEILSHAETADVSFADLSTIEPEVFAQLLSAAALHLPEDSDMLRCIRLGRIAQPLRFHPTRARFISAMLVLGNGPAATNLIHRHYTGIFSHPLALYTGDLVIRRGKATTEWEISISPDDTDSTPSKTAERDGYATSQSVQLQQPRHGAVFPSAARHLLFFSCKGEWPDQERTYFQQK